MNHKFKRERQGHTHMHPVPCMITLVGHYVPQPEQLHVDIPECKPMHVHVPEHHVYVPMDEDDRCWDFSKHVLARHNATW